MFELVYDYTIQDSIYDEQPFYDDDWYKLHYNEEELFIYDEDDYPLSISVEVRKIIKLITVYLPYVEDSYKNSDIFKQAVEYTKETIREMFEPEGYDVLIYQSSK